MNSRAKGVLMGAAVVAACAVPEHGQAHARLAPPEPCTLQNRMMIFVDEDHILWACECEALVSIHICHWQVIGGVDRPSARRFRLVHPRVVVLHA